MKKSNILKTKNELKLEKENKALKLRLKKLEAEVLALKANVELMKDLVKQSQDTIPNYNLHHGFLGIDGPIKYC